VIVLAQCRSGGGGSSDRYVPSSRPEQQQVRVYDSLCEGSDYLYYDDCRRY